MSVTVYKRLDSVDLDSIDAVSLDSIVDALIRRRGWTRERAHEVEGQYRAFLRIVASTSEAVEPSGEVDNFWHEHIISTKKYAADCAMMFGAFLHHNPDGGSLSFCCTEKS